MNYKFAVCAQPLKGEMVSVKSFFGKCRANDDHIGSLAAKVYQLFRIPVCKLHMQKVEGKLYLCALQPLKEQELSIKDLEIISNEISLISQQGDHLSV